MRKIMFNDRYGLTQAVLERRKTMTRRIATALNHPNIIDISEWGVDRNGKAMLTITYDSGLREDVYPNFQIGEVVAVAMVYKTIYDMLEEMESTSSANDWWLDAYDKVGNGLGPSVTPGWNNKMFVRADLMPYSIRITDIKAERLQDISDEDCLREGILQSVDDMDYTFVGWTKRYKGGILRVQVYSKNPREAFAALIDRISGKGIWERNPFVFAYSFELIK